MDKQSKPDVSTGKSPSMRTVRDSDGLVLKDTSPIKTTQGLPVSKTAPILEGSQTTGKSKAPALLALMVILQDFSEVKKRFPQSWIASKNGKIYMCIEGIDTGKLAMMEGKPYLNGVPVSVLLEKAEKNEK